MLNFHRLCYDICYFHLLIQTGGRILKDHLPSGLQHLFIFSRLFFITNVDIMIPDLPPGRLINIHKTSGYRRFSGTGFSHQSKNFSLTNLKRDIIHCADFYFFCQLKQMGEVFYIYKYFVFQCFRPPIGDSIFGALGSNSQVAA